MPYVSYYTYSILASKIRIKQMKKICIILFAIVFVNTNAQNGLGYFKNIGHDENFYKNMLYF